MASIKRYFARMVFGNYVRLKLSPASIIRRLARTTGTYRRTTMLRDIREAQDIEAFGGLVREAPINLIIPKHIMVETELTKPRKYRVFARAKYIDVETDRVTYKNISFYDDTLRTKEQWEMEFIQQKMEAEYRAGDRVDEIDIWAVEHNEGWRY